MKKIDIENWDRKIPKLPDNFFDEMQEKVLKQTVYRKEPKRFRLNLVWSSVAVLVMIFGLTFLIKKEQTEQEIQTAYHDENNKINNEILAESIDSTEKDDADVSQEKEDEIFVTSHKMKTIAQNTERKSELAERQTKERMEKILNAMSEEDFVDLAGNYEQDIYLELY